MVTDSDPPSASGSSLHVPSSLGAGLLRRNSHPTRRSGLVPSPKSTPAPNSASSASSSHVSTPRILSRRNSTRDNRSTGMLSRASSTKRRGRRKSIDESGSFSPRSDEENVIETPQLRVDRDPETGRKMINQYLVLHEIGHGTHGRVRLGKDLSAELAGEDEDPGGGRYAIKIVDRNSKKKRLAGFSRQRRDGGNMVNESEIRKEIAIFKKVNHPNVVRMKEIIDDPDSSKLFMIMEYCEGGEVRWRTGDGRPALTLEKTRSIFRDTLLGLEYLHHQGIIHRDIKPSNLLMHHGVVKISDFGCSHFSEALRAAATQLEDQEYVDDVELAKTAGSPAFFAPEMCYSGLDESSRDIVNLADPLPARPITNAIDVWALGVTLFCLLFGRTPFDAANEYLLMQAIPHVELQLPSHMTSDRLPVEPPSDQVAECLDLIKRLLIKDPMRRITLDQAKRHPFTLRGLPDPSTWLASTDPHVQSFVTVSNDEVAAVVIGSSGFRDKFRKGIRTISNKLQLLGTVGRARGRSVAEGNASPPASVSPGQLPSAPRSPVQTSGIARRLSLRRHRKDVPRAESTAPVRSMSSQDASSSKSPGIYRSLSSQLLQLPRPRPIETTASDASLDLRSSPNPDLAPNLFRRSSDLETMGRRRSESNTGISSKFSRLLSRNNSQNASRIRLPEDDNLDQRPREARPSTSSIDDASSSSSVRGRPLTSPWESRLKSPTLGLPAPLPGHNESQEEIDWNETLSDDEDDGEPDLEEQTDDDPLDPGPLRGRPSVHEEADGALAISVGRSRTVSAVRSSS